MHLNTETLSLMLKFGGGMIGVLLLVFLIAAVTPKLAKVIDRIIGRETKTELEIEVVKKVEDNEEE